MWVGKFALSDEGLPAGGVAWVDLGATAAVAPAVVNGAAYHPTYSSPDGISALYVTTEAVAAADAYIGGFRYRNDGALRVYDATSAVPAGANTNQGIALTNSGQLCYTTGNTTSFSLNGVAVDSSRRVYAAPLAFELQFADLGAGVVSTVEAITTATPTFTRATVAWTKLSTGLWKEIASGSPRSFYSGFTTAVGTYLGYLAEGAGIQLVTPTASIRDMTDASWVKVTVTAAKDAIGIDGVANSASTLTATGATATILQTLVALATSRTYSAWVRRKTGTGTIILRQGTATLDITASINSTTYTRVELNDNELNVTYGFQINTSGDAIEVDFNQFEAGAFATTPMASAGAARNADVLTYLTSGWLNASAGTVFSQYQKQVSAGGACVIWSLDDTTANERMQSDQRTGALDGAVIVDGGAAQVNVSYGAAFTLNTTRKNAFTYALNDWAGCIDGGTVTTDTAVTIPTVTTLHVGSLNDGTLQLYGPIRRVAYYGARLGNATLQGLTT